MHQLIKALSKVSKKIPKVNKKQFPYPLVLIYWEDITSHSQWEEISEIRKSKTAICCSVGWLVESNKDTTVIMADYGFEQDNNVKEGGSYTTVPTKNVIQIKQLST